MEQESTHPIEQEIPEEALAAIEGQVAIDIEPTKDDPETAEWLEGVMRDYRTSEYLFLKWLSENKSTDRILAASAASDLIPKEVFGENVVYSRLGSSEDLKQTKQVVAKNDFLSFPDSTFDAVLVFDVLKQNIDGQVEEFKRVLKPGGLAISQRSIITQIEDDLDFGDFKLVEVPDKFQHQGEADMEFLVYKKPKIND